MACTGQVLVGSSQVVSKLRDYEAAPITALASTATHLEKIMPPTRFEPSSIKNKIKREDVARKSKKAKNQLKLQKRLAQAKLEAEDPAAKKVCSCQLCPHIRS